MSSLDDLKAFNIDEATVSLWVFKGPNGPSGCSPTYTGRWVETTDGVDEILKETVRDARDRIEEAIDYELLVQNHETSVLELPADETHAAIITEAMAAEIEAKRVQSAAHMQNVKFYVIKLVHGETVVHAAKKTDAGWSTKRARTHRSFLFDEHRLTVDNRPHFDIEKSIDFFLVSGQVLALNKGKFESILRYKQAHQAEFAELQAEPDFAAAFVDIAPLIAHVGENKIQLRRVSAIRQKGHFRDADFMQRLRDEHANFGFSIQFDDDGKIIVTPDTCSQIITALLDHRLSSAFSKTIYDVPSSKPIAL